MNKIKSLKPIFLASILTIGVSTITSHNVFATTMTTYTVKSGDCLSLIASKYGQSLSSLRTANNKWNDTIYVGQVLKVNSSTSSKPTTTPTKAPAQNTVKTYTVKSGDCLSTIAKKCGLSLSALRTANNKWNDTIYVGQVLKLSNSTSSTATPTKTPTKAPAQNALKTYTVKSGDCLSTIAKKCGLSLSALRTANNKWNDTIYVGQTLKLSTTATSTTTPQTTPVQQSNAVSIRYTESDLNLLSRLITAEAGGESYNAQLAVGAVVVNRVQNNLFPNSISGVINEHTNNNYQFTVVKNGAINRPASASALKAALSALSGVDPTKNALFFYDGVTPSGLTSTQPVSIVIGRMTFVYLLK